MAGLVIAGTKEAAGLQQAQGLHRPSTENGESEQDTQTQDVYDALSKEGADTDEHDVVHAFQIQDDQARIVAERCLMLHYPAVEEYDFRNDILNTNLEIDLRPATQIRPYQEKSLSKMFGYGRAKGGIIVLLCSAGMTLVGVTAACTMKKGVVVLATNNMSVIQRRSEFLKWSNIDPDSIAVFTSDHETVFSGNTDVITTTYSMVTNSRERAHESAKMIKLLQSREWGLMLLDGVHAVPAQMFRKGTGSIISHSKLGLTATLLREDDKIDDLNFLTTKVQCAEVWCPMSTEFYGQYMEVSMRNRLLLCAMNPVKLQSRQHLIKYHEVRGDKIIVLRDNVYALETSARKLMKPYLYGGTGNAER